MGTLQYDTTAGAPEADGVVDDPVVMPCERSQLVDFQPWQIFNQPLCSVLYFFLLLVLLMLMMLMVTDSSRGIRADARHCFVWGVVFVVPELL